MNYNTKVLRKLKARKAKHGYALDRLGISKIIPAGKILEELEYHYSRKYDAEMVGMNQTDLRIYTDDDTVALMLDSYCEQI